MHRRFFLENPDSGARIGEGVWFTDGAVALHLGGRVPATISTHTLDGLLHRLAMTPESVTWLDPAPVAIEVVGR